MIKKSLQMIQISATNSQHQFERKVAPTMSRYTKYYIALLVIGFSGFTYAIEKIEINPFAEHSFQEAMIYTAPFKNETLGHLGLGDSLSEAKVIVFSNGDENYRAEFQLETSMSVNAEGPHLDLTSWKHCTTKWHNIKALTDNKFQLPNFDKIDTDCFPKVSHDEMKAEVLKQGGKYWVSVLEEEGLPENYSPVDISLSTVRIKIERFVDTEWQVVTVINISIPMGC